MDGLTKKIFACFTEKYIFIAVSVVLQCPCVQLIPVRMALTLLTLSLLVCAGLTTDDYLTWEEDPDPGPSLDTAYVPGTGGAAWTGKEIESTRARILQAIHPDWEVQYNMYGRGNWGTHGKQVTENKMIRLAFHDCVRYTDGTGG